MLQWERKGQAIVHIHTRAYLGQELEIPCMILKIAGVTGRDLDLWMCVRISASACRASMIADSNEDCGLVRARISNIFLSRNGDFV